MTNYTNVSARAMLVNVAISSWRGRKFDKAATAQTNEANDATSKAGRYNKHLLAGATAHAELIAATAAAREAHYRQTLPWDAGWRLLPTANFPEYSKTMRVAFAVLDEKLEAFLDQYPSLVHSAEHAHKELGKLWSAKDYPTVKQLRNKFSWQLEYSPVPSSGDIRVDLPADSLAEIEADITSRTERATREAMVGAWERLHEAVERVKRASGKTKTGKKSPVYDDLFQYVSETCDILGRLNVGQDAQLDAMRARIEKELTSIAVDDLREDDKLRDDTSKRADRILKAMGAFYTPPVKDDSE